MNVDVIAHDAVGETIEKTHIQLTKREIYGLHLLPGVPLVVIFGVFATLGAQWNIPNMFALMGATLFAEVPILWMIMLRFGRKEFGDRLKISDLFPWQERVPVWQYILFGIPLIIFSMIMALVVTPAISKALLISIFQWVPDWFVFGQDPTVFAAMAIEIKLALLIGGLFIMTLLGGITQELYFRGFLLPRMSHLGHHAVPLNAGLFAIFHMTSPWAWPGFFLMAWPWAMISKWKKSTALPIFVHVGMLFFQWFMMSMLLFGVVSMR